jgi:ABC-type polysaccharide/polyol phosphate transport system ATPase subunit
MKYSKGMQTRVCLSLISALPSQLLILDEVFDGADQYFKEKVTHRVTEMIQKSGAALFVTHSIAQVRQVCNRVIVLNNSRIEFDGQVEPGIRYYLENIVPKS